MKIFITALALFTSITCSQSDINYSQKPIKGLTFTPQASELIIENGFLYGTSKSMFTSEELVSYSELTNGLADPVEDLTMNVFTLGIGIGDRTGFSVSIPYIFSHDFMINPKIPNIRSADMLGKTGFSDLIFSTWFLAFNNSSFRSLIRLSAKLPTADYPSEETTFLNSTGTGNTHILLGAAFENELINGFLISTAFDYTYKTEREVARLTPFATSVKEFVKPGDEINIRLRTSYEFTGNFAVGLEGIYTTANRTKVRYETPRENSYYNSLLISPAIGYQYEFVNLNAAYAWRVSGQNISKMDMLSIGLMFNFNLL